MTAISYLLLGLIIGFVLGGVITFSLIHDGSSSNPVETSDISGLLKTQIAYQQSQNMMRQLQLDQARQEAEMRQLEQQRVKYLADATRLNQYDLRKALEAMGEGRQC